MSIFVWIFFANTILLRFCPCWLHFWYTYYFSTMASELVLWTKKILIILVVAAGLYILWMLSSIITLILIAGFLTIVMNPLIDLGERHGAPSWLTLI